MTHNYPTKKVISYYSLFGGIVGGLLFCIGASLYKLIVESGLSGIDTSLEIMKDSLFGIFFILLASWIFGFIPAWLTGLTLAKTHTDWQIIKPFYIGAILSFILTFSAVGLFGIVVGDNFELKGVLEILKNSIIFALLGGFSSVIIGKFVLPKAKS